MSLPGRFANERERLGPEFTDAERKWRIKWYKEQNLHPSEPIIVPELYCELRNPLRRFYQIPLNYLEHKLLSPRIVSPLSADHHSVLILSFSHRAKTGPFSAVRSLERAA